MSSVASETGIIMRDLYLNDSFDYIISKPITEYDMKDAGFNLSKYYKLLPQSKIDYLESLEKHRRTVQIGIYMRDDKEFNEALTKSFGKMRKQFIEANEIEDSDILSIKKDAIFIIGRNAEYTSFGNVTFAPKHKYSSYHKLPGLELYYNRTNKTLDVKGIADDVLDHHRRYTISMLLRFFGYLETYNYEEFTLVMKSFVKDYKERNLRYGYYREFNSISSYSVQSTSEDMYHYYVDHIGSDFDDILDISYNYLNVYLPLIQRHYFGNEN